MKQLTAFSEHPSPTRDLPCENATRELINELFAPTPTPSQHQALMEERIASMTRKLLVGGRDGVGSSTSYAALEKGFASCDFPENPIDPKAYLDYLETQIVPHANRTWSPKFVGHMTTALPYFVRPLARLVATLNQNVVKVETAKVVTPCERQVLARFHRLIFGCDSDFYAAYSQERRSTLGMVTSGGTTANLTALWCARNKRLGPIGYDGGVEQLGVAEALKAHGYSSGVVIGSRLMHYSIEKAADLLGLGRRAVIRVATDRQQRVDVDALRTTIGKCQTSRAAIVAVIGTAGTTDAGSVDSLRALADEAHKADAHFHVDMAWGGAVLCSDHHRLLLDGIKDADSVTLDGHKQLYLPVGLGMVLLRDPMLAEAIEMHAWYVARSGSRDLGSRSVEGSRPANVLLLDAALSLIGRRGYGYLIDEGMRKAQWFAREICARESFELLSEPQLNVVLYRVVPSGLRAAQPRNGHAGNRARVDWFNTQLQKRQRAAGNSFVSRTKIQLGDHPPSVALRAVIANPLTTETDLHEILDEQTAIAAALEGELAEAWE